MTANTTPTELAALGSILLNHGYVLNHNKYVSPLKSLPDITFAYTYREASVWFDERLEYRGEHPYNPVVEVLSRFNKFSDLADMIAARG